VFVIAVTCFDHDESGISYVMPAQAGIQTGLAVAAFKYCEFPLSRE